METTTKQEGRADIANQAIQRLSESWPRCLHCGAPVDDQAPSRGVPVHHYWTEEVACHEGGTIAAPDPHDVARLEAS